MRFIARRSLLFAVGVIVVTGIGRPANAGVAAVPPPPPPTPPGFGQGMLTLSLKFSGIAPTVITSLPNPPISSGQAFNGQLIYQFNKVLGTLQGSAQTGYHYDYSFTGVGATYQILLKNSGSGATIDFANNINNPVNVFTIDTYSDHMVLTTTTVGDNSGQGLLTVVIPLVPSTTGNPIPLPNLATQFAILTKGVLTYDPPDFNYDGPTPISFFDIQADPVPGVAPEPATVVTGLLGVVGAVIFARRRKRSA